MKIYLASAPRDLKYLIKNKTPYVLISYYYFRGKKIQEKWRPYFSQFKDVIIDSGAFSMMRDKKKACDLDKYVEDYIKFVKKYHFKHYIELDIDSVIGYDRVKQYREKLENGIGWKSIPVWHKSRGLKEWENIIEKYEYVGIGGIVTGEIKRTDFALFDYLLNLANKEKVKVHGLGITSLKLLKRLPFYSVDSSTWRVNAAWGGLSYFNKDNLENYNCEKYKNNKDYRNMIDFNCKEWTKFAYWAEMHL